MFRTLVLALLFASRTVAFSADTSASLSKILDDPKPDSSDVTAARRLLHHGASYNTVGKRGVTVVMFAARWGDAPFLRDAIQAGADINARADLGWTALMVTTPEKMRMLLKAGANPNAQDNVGRTPLMWAAMSKSREGIELLLAYGAKPDLRNAKGYSAIVYAEGSPALQQLLRDRGAR